MQISNMKKIKKMSKKQLRQIKKADTSGVKPKLPTKNVATSGSGYGGNKPDSL